MEDDTGRLKEVETGEVVYTPNPLAPNATVALVEQPTQNWVSEWCFWNNCNPCIDLPLCCYTTWCKPCAWGEVMEGIETPAPGCASPSCESACCCLYVASYVNQVVVASLSVACPNARLCFAFANFIPLITMHSRKTLGSKYGLYVDDCGGPCCLHYWCFSCALYQEALYVKHVLKKEPHCCCYTNWCKPVCFCGDNPAPGEISTLRSHQQIALVTTHQPLGQVV